MFYPQQKYCIISLVPSYLGALALIPWLYTCHNLNLSLAKSILEIPSFTPIELEIGHHVSFLF